MCEVDEETRYVRHHKQKIVLVLSAMRHFAAELRAEGITIDYIELDAPANTGCFGGELERAICRHRPDHVVMTEPGEWRVADMARSWSNRFSIPIEIREDDRFFSSRAEFARWAAERKSYRMEFFYREMRRETGILMDGDLPEGGRWNFDAENRKRLPRKLEVPSLERVEPDVTTRAVMALVAERYADHFGELDGFGWAVSRADARLALSRFVERSLKFFGDFQDAMKREEPFLFHSVLSPYLNIGLLTPREVCKAAVDAYTAGLAPLNAVEGFVRQILGWREYIRGIYWLRMPGYATTNAFSAGRPLPHFYWDGRTAMACVAAAVSDTRRNAYAHHIQRLMITGNFALIAGLDPGSVEAWYLAVYADAFDWVELPNTHGMALFADGGLLASKPYAASGAYIDRMSDYCEACCYDPRVKIGARACPFNFLYWNFLIVNEDSLASNPRMALPYRSLGGMTETGRADIRQQATAFLDALDSGANNGDTHSSPRQLDLDLL